MKVNKMSGIGGVVAILMVIEYAEANLSGGKIFGIGGVVHGVGDAFGWRRPESPSFYSEWASRNTFKVGDTLMFSFEKGLDVLEVIEHAYDLCSSENPIGGPWKSGSENITLTSGGPHYYICGENCLSGQKFAINVSESASELPPSTDSLLPPSSSSAPTSIPVLFLFSAFIIVAF